MSEISADDGKLLEKLPKVKTIKNEAREGIACMYFTHYVFLPLLSYMEANYFEHILL